MKIKRTTVFIGVSSLALLIVLLIQVKWVYETARLKEDIFNEKANIVISKTAEEISTDTAMCRSMEECVGKDEIHKTDSIFVKYMSLYNFQMDYSFDVKNPAEKSAELKNENAFNDNVYKKRLDEEASKSGLELNLVIPDKKQFILREMGSMFVTSVLLIIIVLFMFWRTVVSFTKEKKIAEHMNDFLNNMTHEFKTPLTNIAMAGNMVIKESGEEIEPKIKLYSEIILQENEKLRRQVDQVLSMSALENGEIPLIKIKTDIHQLLKEASSSMKLQVDHKEGEINLHSEAQHYFINGDKIHLFNCFCNLIDNAIKYCDRRPNIVITTRNENDKLIISFADNGIGIDKEFTGKIFEKYFRIPTGNVHDVKGFGLGLSYVKKIIELHEGGISIHSDKDTGTVISLTFNYV